jgi:putative NIF3 family GTP cyclohydrolase 1 type 2
MTRDIFRDRERGEEDAYFRQQDAKLIAKLRQKAQLSEIAHALAEKLHADEPALLERIRKLGVTLDTGSAFILAPLVEVAWVDGDVSHAERDTILHIAKQHGVTPESADYHQLLDWLAHRPSDEVFRTALEAIRMGLSVLPPDESEQRIATMIKACQDVAQAAGWIDQLFQLDRVSHAESAVIAAIRGHLESKKTRMSLAGPAVKEA